MTQITENSNTLGNSTPSRPAYEEAAIKLRNYIEKNQFNPGDNLPPERKLAEQFKVSRHTLRQAFRVMEEKGILVSKRGSGTYIAPNSLIGLKQSLATCLDSETDQLNEIFEFRKILEPQVAALAAKNHKPFHVDALKNLIGQQILTIEPVQLKQIDRQFHAMIAFSPHGRKMCQTIYPCKTSRE
ncbi:MAG: FadR family transcriptional regulator [Rhizobiales bacterium]|nr:FadR family transcriptional regulator [Hyphomicrobiales bacterium]